MPNIQQQRSKLQHQISKHLHAFSMEIICITPTHILYNQLRWQSHYLVLPYKPNISLIHSILYYKLFAYICKFLYLYNIILADIYA